MGPKTMKTDGVSKKKIASYKLFIKDTKES